MPLELLGSRGWGGMPLELRGGVSGMPLTLGTL